MRTMIRILSVGFAALALTMGASAEDVKPEVVVQEWHGSSPRFTAYSADGKYIFSRSFDEIKVWNEATGALIRTFTKDDGISNIDQVKFSPVENIFVCNDRNGNIVLCNIKTGVQSIFASSRDYSFAFSNDGAWLAGCNKHTITIYNTKTKQPEYSLDAGNFKCREIMFSPKDSYLLAIATPEENAKYLRDYHHCIIFDLSKKKLCTYMTQRKG